MDAFFDFLSRVISGVFKLALGLAALIFMLSLLLASLVLVVGVSLWALVTGRKPAPVMAFERFRQTSQRYAQGAWVRRPTGTNGGTAAASRGDVVDVQAHVVPDDASPRPSPKSGPEPMGRMQH